MNSTTSTDKYAQIRDFWEDQAKQHSTDLRAVMPDPLGKDLEVGALERHLDFQKDTLEVGCGNGVNIVRLLPRFEGRLTGIDYSAAMIAAAKKAIAGLPKAERVQLRTADLTGPLDGLGPYPQIFTVRCLINLPTFEQQSAALARLADLLLPGGRLFLIEGFQQGMQRINQLRELVGLSAIPYHWHNLYVDETRLLAELPPSLRLVEDDNFMSLYYLVSRIFNAKLTPPGQPPDYMAEINKIACKLPAAGDFAPVKMLVFEKKR